MKRVELKKFPLRNLCRQRQIVSLFDDCLASLPAENVPQELLHRITFCSINHVDP